MRRKHVILLAIVALLGLWLGFAGTVLVAAGRPVRGDALFVLSGDSGSRLRAGVDVMRRTPSDRLVVFLDLAEPVYDPRDDALGYIERRGIPTEKVRFVTQVRSTAQEAGAAAALVRRCGWRRVVIVTSPYHTRRAGWLFRRALGGTDVRIVSDNAPFDSGLWWRQDLDRELVLTEWLKGIAAIGYLIRRPAGRDPGVPC